MLLNEILPYATTAENLAKWLFDWAVQLGIPVSAVRVSETPKTWAEFNAD